LQDIFRRESDQKPHSGPFCFSVKRFIGKDFFRLFRIDPMTKLEVEGVSLIPFKINYSQICSPALKVIHNMTFFLDLVKLIRVFKMKQLIFNINFNWLQYNL